MSTTVLNKYAETNEEEEEGFGMILEGRVREAGVEEIL